MAGGSREPDSRVKADLDQTPPGPLRPDEIAQANAELRSRPPREIVRWAIDRAGGRAIVSTNFRPFEAVILHLCAAVSGWPCSRPG